MRPTPLSPVWIVDLDNGASSLSARTLEARPATRLEVIERLVEESAFGIEPAGAGPAGFQFDGYGNAWIAVVAWGPAGAVEAARAWLAGDSSADAIGEQVARCAASLAEVQRGDSLEVPLSRSGAFSQVWTIDGVRSTGVYARRSAVDEPVDLVRVLSEVRP